MSVEETPVEEPEEPSRAAGGCVIAVLVGAAGAVVFAVSTEVGILASVAAVTGAVWWAAKRVPHAPNPAPPPPSEGADETKPQFTVVPDADNPARSIVTWNTRKEPRP